jgi:hypothetical protein
LCKQINFKERYMEERSAKLTQMGDPLVSLNAQINWEAFQADLKKVHEKERRVMREPSQSTWS